MAFEIPLFKPGAHKAGADLSALQFTAVKLSGVLGVVTIGTQGESCYGLLQNKPISGEAAEIMEAGISKAYAGAAFAVGAELMADVGGKLIAATSAKEIVAIALEASTANGDLVTVLLRFKGLKA